MVRASAATALLGLAAATAQQLAPPKPKPKQPMLNRKTTKIITKKLRTGKVQRAIRKQVDARLPGTLLGKRSDVVRKARIQTEKTARPQKRGMLSSGRK